MACGKGDWLCQRATGLLYKYIWHPFIQRNLVPAQHFRNPGDLNSYLQHSNFLADINNERDNRNQTYSRNIANLDNFIMHTFSEDEMVVPTRSGRFDEVIGARVTELRNREIYTEDWIGLKELDQKGGLDFISLRGTHLELSDKRMRDTFKKYFGPTRDEKAKLWHLKLSQYACNTKIPQHVRTYIGSKFDARGNWRNFILRTQDCRFIIQVLMGEDHRLLALKAPWICIHSHWP
jgi:hypothetical protein